MGAIVNNYSLVLTEMFIFRAKKVKLSNELSLKKETIRELQDKIESLKDELTSQKMESKKQSEKIRELQQSMQEYQLEISQLKEHNVSTHFRKKTSRFSSLTRLQIDLQI